jgi:dihydrofolate reductase
VANLLYFTTMSLDGYVEDPSGDFGFSVPSEEVHQFANDSVRDAGTHLYGRRMYETMAVWETDPSFAEDEPVMTEFAALWQAADKVVYSMTLDAPVTSRTRIERTFDPAAVAALKEESPRDLLIGGATLAAEAFRAGLVDECVLVVVPFVTGGGKPALPGGVRLSLVSHGDFENGTVYLRYRVLPL